MNSRWCSGSWFRQVATLNHDRFSVLEPLQAPIADLQSAVAGPVDTEKHLASRGRIIILGYCTPTSTFKIRRFKSIDQTLRTNKRFEQVPTSVPHVTDAFVCTPRPPSRIDTNEFVRTFSWLFMACWKYIRYASHRRKSIRAVWMLFVCVVSFH